MTIVILTLCVVAALVIFKAMAGAVNSLANLMSRGSSVKKKATKRRRS